MPDNTQEIQRAFAVQAETFNAYQNDAFKNTFSETMVQKLKLAGTERALEVAAGTCALGRMIAPSVSTITEFDISSHMLDVGRKANEAAGVKNAEYVLGNAEDMPYPADAFDLVVTRLSFHHFANPEKIMSEIARVVKGNGKVAILDMVPPDVSTRDSFDHFETLRDSSHVRCFTAEELSEMAKKCGLEAVDVGREIIPMNLENWMKLTKTSPAAQREITEALTEDLSGGASSGMDPYMESGRIMFRRHWAYLIAKKSESK